MQTDHLATLEERGLIRLAQPLPDLEYLFRHALVQDAAYASLLRADRKRLHRLVGELLEQLYPAQHDDLAALLAEHFAHAGDDATALRYYTRAGQSAARKWANAEAAAHYGHAIDLATRNGADAPTLISFYQARGRALELAGRHDAALATYAALEAAGRERGDRTLELAGLVAATIVRCIASPYQDVTAGVAFYTRALALARDLGDRAAESRILWAMMLLHGTTGSAPIEQSLGYGEESLRLARDLGLRDQIAQTLNDLAYGYGLTGQEQAALAALAESQTIWREHGNLPMLTDNLTATALRLQARGDNRASFAPAEEGYRISQSIGNRWGLAFSCWIRGTAYMHLGEIGQALVVLDEAVRMGKQAGFVIAVEIGHVLMSGIYYDLGAYGPARTQAEAAIAFAAARDAASVPAQARLALIEAAAGDWAAATTRLAQARAALRPDDWIGYPIALAELCEFNLARASFAEALADADEFLNGGLFQAARAFAPRFWLYKGHALRGLGDLAAATTALTKAYEMSGEQEARPVLWPTLATLADLADQRDAPAEAAALRSQARTHLTYMADQIPDPALRASFLAQPAAQRVQTG